MTGELYREKRTLHYFGLYGLSGSPMLFPRGYQVKTADQVNWSSESQFRAGITCSCIETKTQRHDPYNSQLTVGGKRPSKQGRLKEVSREQRHILVCHPNFANTLYLPEKVNHFQASATCYTSILVSGLMGKPSSTPCLSLNQTSLACVHQEELIFCSSTCLYEYQ